MSYERLIDKSNFDAVVVGSLNGFPIHLGVKTSKGFLNRVEFLSRVNTVKEPKVGSLAEEVKVQLIRYLSDPLFKFELPLKFESTKHQKVVWNKLCDIPVGQTKSYSEFAAEMNSGARAVGNACRKNPLPVVIPCHRVVAKSGIGGFAGASAGGLIDLKTALLSHEGAILL